MASDVQKTALDLLFDQFRLIIREEIQAALAERKPQKLLYTTKEAAVMLGVEESWLASKARAGLVPFRMMGHYRLFSMADIAAIMDRAGVDKRTVPVVQIEHEGQGVSTDTETARVDPSKTRGADGNNGD